VRFAIRPILAWNSVTSRPFASITASPRSPSPIIDNDTLLVQARTHQNPVARLLNIQCLGQCCVISSEKRIDHTGRGLGFGCWKARRIASCAEGDSARWALISSGLEPDSQEVYITRLAFRHETLGGRLHLSCVSPGITSTGTCTGSNPVSVAL
jgi:hypothetical protein